MKVVRVTVSRPRTSEKEDMWEKRREAFVVADEFGSGGARVVSHYNDLEGVDDYFVVGMDLVASNDNDGSGAVLII